MVPALRAQGLLGPAERVDLRLDGEPAGRPPHSGSRGAVVVAGTDSAAPDRSADSADGVPQVHVHIGTVQVVRPPTTPTAPAAPTPDPASDRLATFLAGRRAGR